MCGRYTLATPVAELSRIFGFAELPNLAPRYNIAPTQEIAAVRLLRDEERRELVLMRWGLVPYWADDPSIGSRMINARSGSVADKPAFRSAFARRRCLVLVDGFYEWQQHGVPKGGKKQPYRIRRRDGQPFAAAQLSGIFGVPGGKDESPQLSWTAGPSGTKSYVDAPTGSGFWHWTVYDIPATIHQLAAGAGTPGSATLPAGAIQAPDDASRPDTSGLPHPRAPPPTTTT
mgnify:CR=1 FL=1